MISIFTPSHKPEWLSGALESLREQTVIDWEWVVLLNNGARWSCDDPRVKVAMDDTGIKAVGYLKRKACELCSGDILLELDHDDLLFPTALKEVEAAFSDESVTFVYSNSVCHDVRTDEPIRWHSKFGWSHRPVTFRGKEYVESVSAPPDPQSISRIWFAPNHLRAWRKTAYWAMGGHNATMQISDDHDLMMRTFIHGRMRHVDKPLYLYRVHGDNTWLHNQTDIQRTMWEIHDKYVERMAFRWADDRRLKKVDICSGVDGPANGYVGVDRHFGSVRANLDRDWPFRDESIGVLRAQDAVEHLYDPIHTMNEAWRVLAHGGYFFLAVPSTKGEGAFSDPTHRSFWNVRSFSYYTDPKMAKFIPGLHCRFQAIKLWEDQMWDVPFVFAHLVALKDGGVRFYGECLWGDR